MKKPNAGELPLARRRRATREKTKGQRLHAWRGSRAAFDKAEELVAEYEPRSGRVRVAAEAFDNVRLGLIRAEASEAATARRIEQWSRASVDQPKHPDWTNRRTAYGRARDRRRES